MLRLLLTLSLTFTGLLATAQTGVIRGKISDAKTKEGIIGATVRLEGTSHGTQTDVSGAFVINNIPAGTHKVSVTYISYQTREIPNVRVESGNTTTLETELIEEGKTLSDVVVRASRSTNTEVAVISEIKQFKPIAVGISSLQIQKSQDRDAAAAIRRVPGVSIVDNRFVMVRGLSSRYNTVMVNDMITPSTEVDVRSFSFDLIPSNILDRMIIFKSGAAELPGDFAGGVIKIYTKKKPDRNFTDVGVTLGYRANTTFKDVQSHDRGSMAWLGLWDKSQQIPTSFPTDAATFNNLPAAVRSSYAQLFPNSWALTPMTVTPDIRLAFNLGRRFDIGETRISNLTSINYSNTNQFSDISLRTYNNGSVANDLAQRYNDAMYQRQTRLGVLHNWAFKFSPSFNMEWKTLFNQLGNTETTVRNGESVVEDRDIISYSERFENRSILTSQLSGENIVSDQLKLDWMAGFGYTGRWEPDWKRVRYQREKVSSGPQNEFTVSTPNDPSPLESGRFWSKTHEFVYSGAVNVQKKFGNPADREPATLRFGAYVEQKDRDFNARFYGYQRQGNMSGVSNLPIDQVFGNQHIGGAEGSYSLRDGTKAIDSYNASNTYLAGYVGGDVYFSPKASLTLGFRGEYNIRKLGNPNDASLVNQGIFSPLPSLNFTYKLSDKQNLRLAYSYTVNRPEFREQAPFSYYDFSFNADVRGNQTLKTATIQNVDAKWELYPSDGELISVTGFYKYFQNPIENFLLPQANGLAYTFINTKNATSYGIELEARKSLASTGVSFLKNLTLVGNVSLIKSTISLGDVVKAPDLSGAIQDYDLKGITDTKRAMMNQSPYLINAGIYYAAPSGWQANILYNVFGPRIFAVGNVNSPTVYEMPRNVIDLNVSKTFAKRWEVRVGIQDVLNQAYRLSQDFNHNAKIDKDVTSQTANADQEIRRFKRGSYSTVSLVYTFGRSIIP
ncbi:TonB-dependent receptor [Siphonobacter aquaeclarae]|uniref:TonB-dependent receptor n=1 Tax=Siphonobacter aquaeclarae TaxID=563176 RepID=A0A1G9NI75_9BACT|nr:TonB-dependent receptor [Siphonobacter aquaeclarae]SDL86033.1 TonB-dependent receptor [Siphonobacter aquaeclarae]